MAKETQYTSNPLRLAVDGTKSLFQKAPMVAIVLAILSSLSVTGNYGNSSTPTTPEAAPVDLNPAADAVMLVFVVVFILVALFGVLIVWSILTGIASYSAAEIAKGREVTFKQAAKATFDRLWSFVWLQLLTVLKVLAWTLLFIVPGIIMAVRYSLANLSFFDDTKKLKGNAAIKDSIALTKGAWLTTFGTQAFFSIITLGLIAPIIDAGSKVALYRQFTALEAAGAPKPKAHVLSWVTLGLCILLALIGVGILSLAIATNGFTNVN
jgi:hypothetical protein